MNAHRVLIAAIALVACLAGGVAEAKPGGAAKASAGGASDAIVHVVYAGHTLGKIAKRYNVTVAELCAANGISRKSKIRPGQRLVIPVAGKSAKSKKERSPEPPAPHPKRPSSGTRSDLGSEPSHRTASPALARSQRSATRERAGSAKSQSTGTRSDRPEKKLHQSWRRFKRPAPKLGYVTLRGTAGSYSGYVVLKGGLLSPRALAGVRRVLASWRTGKQTDISERLVRVLTQVSDTFGGRALRIVGGYREHSFYKESKHRLGRAVDFSVDGVPNEALRDYLRTLPNVGVGYYPNSSFVHLDVRSHRSYWVDYSRPGERPRTSRALATAGPGAAAAPLVLSSTRPNAPIQDIRPEPDPSESNEETPPGAEPSETP